MLEPNNLLKNSELPIDEVKTKSAAADRALPLIDELRLMVPPGTTIKDESTLAVEPVVPVYDEPGLTAEPVQSVEKKQSLLPESIEKNECKQSMTFEPVALNQDVEEKKNIAPVLQEDRSTFNEIEHKDEVIQQNNNNLSPAKEQKRSKFSFSSLMFCCNKSSASPVRKNIENKPSAPNQRNYR